MTHSDEALILRAELILTDAAGRRYRFGGPIRFEPIRSDSTDSAGATPDRSTESDRIGNRRFSSTDSEGAEKTESIRIGSTIRKEPATDKFCTEAEEAEARWAEAIESVPMLRERANEPVAFLMLPEIDDFPSCVDPITEDWLADPGKMCLWYAAQLNHSGNLGAFIPYSTVAHLLLAVAAGLWVSTSPKPIKRPVGYWRSMVTRGSFNRGVLNLVGVADREYRRVLREIDALEEE